MSSFENPNFITVEGVDGAGKSTHVNTLVQQLKDLGYDVVHTREPGGTPFGEKLRQQVLQDPMEPITECMLMFAARTELLRHVVRPALDAGKIVVCDRFTDSTWAYQGGGWGAPRELIAAQEAAVHGDLQPGLTLLFDLPVEESLRRLGLTGKAPDKFESQRPEFFQRVRDAYLDRSAAPRFRIVRAEQTPELVARQVENFLAEHLPRLRPAKALGGARSGPRRG